MQDDRNSCMVRLQYSVHSRHDCTVLTLMERYIVAFRRQLKGNTNKTLATLNYMLHK